MMMPFRREKNSKLFTQQSIGSPGKIEWTRRKKTNDEIFLEAEKPVIPTGVLFSCNENSKDNTQRGCVAMIQSINVGIIIAKLSDVWHRQASELSDYFHRSCSFLACRCWWSLGIVFQWKEAERLQSGKENRHREREKEESLPRWKSYPVYRLEVEGVRNLSSVYLLFFFFFFFFFFVYLSIHPSILGN